MHARFQSLLAAVLLALLCLPAAAQRAEVRIDGLSGELLDNARARLSIRNAAMAGEREVHMLERLHLRAANDIRRALEPFGYYNADVDSDFEADDDGNVRARYVVDPGPRIRLRNVDIGIDGEGADDEALQAAVARIRLREGDPLDHRSYEDAKSSLTRAAFARGYFDVEYDRSEIRVQRSENAADIVLRLTTGRRFRIAEIRIDQDTLDDDVLRRYVQIGEGDYLSPSRLLRAQFDLMDLGYFSRVDIEPLRDEAEDDLMPVLIQPEYLLPQRYSLGVGYGTDTGPRVSLTTELRRINRRGHWVNSDLQLSTRRQRVGASYNIPLGNVPGDRLSFTSSYRREDFEDGKSRRYVLGTSLSRQPGSWHRRLYLDFSVDDFEVGAVDRTTTLLMPGISFERAEMDDEIYTRRGWRAFWDVHGASEQIVSSTSFVQSRISLRGVHGIGERSRLLARFEYGASLVDSFDRLPLTERFYAGGDQSVRGFAYQSLGERDDDGNVIGGRFLTTMSLELDRLIWGNIGAAVFVDGGNASLDAFPDPLWSAGVGMRYRAPIGSFRIDVARPVRGELRDVRLHLGISVGL